MASGEQLSTYEPVAVICLVVQFSFLTAGTQETGGYYNFSNIRYGQPPIGSLRFAPPKPPRTNRSTVNDGQDGRICPQAVPQWSKERPLFLQAYYEGMGNVSSFTNAVPPGINITGVAPGPRDPRTNEDCLFLEVIVPKTVYHSSTSRAPVFVWTFGGGFYEGDLEAQGNPAGLLAQSMTNPDTAPGIVYVSINYRLGALGWLAGPTFTSSGGTPNLGIYDQRLAFEWIQENIHHFGGDRDRVTAGGESAGASITMHQITAFGGLERAPFQQAYIASPAFNPNPYDWQQEKTYQLFLNYAKVSTLAELQAASSETVIRANELLVYNSTFGASNGIGLVVDGNIVPQLAALLLAQGRRAKNVQAVFTGHTTNEGFLFADPSVQNATAFNDRLQTVVFPDVQPDILNYIINTLYPPIFSNKKDLGLFFSNETSIGYNDTISRLATLQADFILTSNAHALLKAFAVNNTYAYLFGEGLGLHGEDTTYTFYNYGPTEDTEGIESVNATVARASQDWILSFTSTGNPNGKGEVTLPPYGNNRTMGLLSNLGLGITVADPAGKERCDFWEKALYF